MKFSARTILTFIFIFFAFFFIPHVSLVKTANAGVFDFDLETYVQQRIDIGKEEERTGKASVNVGNVTSYTLPVAGAETINLIMPLSPQLNPGQTRAIPALAQVMGKMYEYPPASAMAYTYDLLHNAGLLTKPAYAQGIGFAGLAPLLPLWKMTRNIAYSVLIVVMLAIGFMIIFRMKIDPKTVISVQSAIPKIILTLILITFSYPIAGFFIDLMYLSIFILVEIITKAIPNDLVGWSQFIKDTPNLQQAFIQTGIPGWGNLFTSVFSFGLVPALWDQFFKGSVGNIVGEAVGGGGIALFLTRSLSMTGFFTPLTLGLAAIPLILLFLIALGLLFTFIRLTFLLVNSYIQLLLAVILGPLLLLKEAIPGQSAFGDYVKNIAANLIVFPATIALIMFSQIITAVMLKSNLWGAPMIPVGGGGDVGGSGNPLSIFVGLGIIFLTPSLVASIKKAMGAKATIPVTAGTAFSPITGAVSTGMGAMQSFYYFQQPFQSGPLAGFVQKLTGKSGESGAAPAKHSSSGGGR